jgi:hypothetical protein
MRAVENTLNVQPRKDIFEQADGAPRYRVFAGAAGLRRA